MSKQKQSKIYRARDIPSDFSKTYDVVVIGSGAGGASAAQILAESGFTVLILEQGPYRTNKDFSLLEKDTYADLYQDVAARKTKDKGITILQGRSVGGSTTVNWTSSFRTPQPVIQHWINEHGLKEFANDELSPWFDQVHKDLSIKKWTLPPNENNKVLLSGCETLGFHTEAIPRNVNGCANLGYCGFGCPINAKQSMLVTAIPAAIRAGASLLSRAMVARLKIDNNEVQGVEVQALDQYGRPANQNLIEISARHVILSAGAIGSPAVLLRSQASDPHKQIGKRTFLHPVVGTAAIMSQIIDGFQGAPQSIYSDHFLWRDGVTGDLGYKLEVPPLHPSLTSSIVPGFGKSHRSVMKKYRHLQSIIALLRDGFHPEDVGGEVSLDSNNLPVLDYPLREHFWQAALHSLEMMASIQFAAGAKVVIPVHQRGTPSRSMSDFKKQIAELPLRASQMGIFSAHVMGGCAMGADPESSVVRADGRAHHLENLSIMDGSVLPTSLGVNPQVTLYSLVRRNTHALIQHLVR